MSQLSNVKCKLSNVVHVVIAILSIAIIVYLNFSLVRFLFIGEFSQIMDSIEISYIQMAKFWVEGGGLWQPLWYFGYPWHVFYSPLLPALEVLTHQILEFSFAHAYRVIAAAGYVLVPVSLFFFVWQISKSKTGALISALFYSFVPSIIAVIFNEVRQDTLSSLFEPRRFTILVRWGEGPHTLSLVFVPLFGVFLSRFSNGRKFIDLVCASFFLGLAALTNPAALWAAFLLVLAFIFAEIFRKGVVILDTVKNLFILGILTFGLIAFWYNLPFISTFSKEGSGALNNWSAMFPWGFFPILAVFLAIFLIVGKLTKGIAGLTLSTFWFLALFAIVFIYYASGESHLEYIPQALRLNTEVDMALAVVLGVLVSKIFLFLTEGIKRLKFVTYPLALLILFVPIVTLLFWWDQLRQVLPEFTKPLSASRIGDIKNTAEYLTANKLKELTAGTDQRIVVSGNYGFWLNFFENVPQIRGGHFQSSTHFWPDHAYYQITNGADGQISLAWLKIANVGKLVYSTAGSKEPFKDYKVPVEKFSGVLKENLSENGDIYFDVPLKNDSLAKVVDANAFKQIIKPTNAIDSKPIHQYVNWLEQKADKKLKLTKISNSRYKIEGELGEGEAVLFQQTYDSGWKVKTLRPIRQAQGRQDSGQGGGWKVVKDPLDFMVLVPKNSGRFEIELVYGKPISVWLGYLITAITLGWILYKTSRTYRTNRT